MQTVFAIQSRGFGDDEDTWENIGVVFDAYKARKTAQRLQADWDLQDGNNLREVRRSPYWRKSYRFEQLDVL
jgi:hypothetical protein